jgi:DNA-binding transcriptional LysR family regulator
MPMIKVTAEAGAGDAGGSLSSATDALAPRLRQFVAVAREEHMSRAAELLDVPQPTLSRSIARLEADLGVPLFSRQGRGLRLTRQGRLLLAGAERALAELEANVQLLADEVSASHGKVALAFLQTLGPHAVPVMLRDFRARHPHVRFTLYQGSGSVMLAKLRAGEVDLCLVSPPPDEPDIIARPLDEQRIDLLVPAGHKFARTPSRRQGGPAAPAPGIALAEAAGEEFVCLKPGYGLRGITDDLCAAAGFTPRVAFEGEDVDTVRGLVGAGLGVALLPDVAGTRSGNLKVVGVRVTEPHASRTVALAWLAGPAASPPVAAFRDFTLRYQGRLFSRG